MKRIVYAGSELITGDAIADALMAFSQALAEEAAAETVEIPVMDADGNRAAAMLLVGPASQIVAFPITMSSPELVDELVVQSLRKRTARLRPAVRAEEQDFVDDLSWADDD